MNKQELANKIWQAANKMRSKIEANEYKDYILGFLFYKFLSDKEIDYLKNIDWTDEEIKDLTEDDEETVKNCKNSLGYFISYNNLYSTWIDKGKDFDSGDVTDALNAFERNIEQAKVFSGVFDTLKEGLSKLGATPVEKTSAVRDLIELIEEVPTDDKQGYDVLGFVYEYLIYNFAANAGKKAGEFYTPFEVSSLMAEIIANHLKDREKIEIYDSCSGSGSLLITIGKAVSKHLKNKDGVKYYAQELKENTYNLTRMNLAMRGIKADNIEARRGDTLGDDWPFFVEKDGKKLADSYQRLRVDAVTTNPPYSADWADVRPKQADERFDDYGLAPKKKADYAFLLHDLYHVKPDGIMTIVLPHGVLFRGGDEQTIRSKLIEKNQIDAIIGLPANIFFGTGIPTIIMILKPTRENDDILIIDASKGFIKEGKNNKLRACDIKKITDAVKNRKNIDKFCRVVSRQEIRDNDYNLNIPRYVDSSEKAESWDIYSTMFGGIPNNEIDELGDVWKAFPSLKDELFKSLNDSYSEIKTENIKETILNNKDVKKFIEKYNKSLDGFNEVLNNEFIENIDKANVNSLEDKISDEIFTRLSDLPLVNPYEAYQYLDDEYKTVSNDIEIVQTEGSSAYNRVDELYVKKKSEKSDKEETKFAGYEGHIIPFSVVQNSLLKDEADKVNVISTDLTNTEAEIEELINNLAEEDKGLLNDNNDAFVAKAVADTYKEILNDVSTDETDVLNEYLSLKKKDDKLDFIASHNEVKWTSMELSKDQTYSAKVVKDYMLVLKSNAEFEEDTTEYNVQKAYKLLEQQKVLKKQLKEAEKQLESKTKETIQNLSDKDIKQMLYLKWISPIVDNINKIPTNIIDNLNSKIDYLSKKYLVTYSQLDEDINQTENELSFLLNELEGNDYDNKGIEELKSLLGGK